MTDIVFGGLRYFEPDQGGIAVNWLMPDVVEAGSLLKRVSLWPIRNRVEPDVVIDLARPDGMPLRLIVECKYEDFLLTAEQLEKQWRQFGPGSPGALGEVHHVLVVQRRLRVEPEAYAAAPPEVRSRRTLLLWRDLAAAANGRHRAHGGAPLNAWIDDVVQVLDAVDERAFIGWRSGPGPQVEVDKPFVFASRYWDDPRLTLDLS
ncbi:hypothetical protein G5575_01530 [Devosia chinhatensis]|uniref:PD-(D/E)XK nuclease superfamily protein n=2 Tax=Devosia aurantiaca TaxID=2714858 RepID=A0A6M1SLY2_9HYPH|nr:hypothetical protein [Devosia aurantiaca]